MKMAATKTSRPNSSVNVLDVVKALEFNISLSSRVKAGTEDRLKTIEAYSRSRSLPSPHDIRYITARRNRRQPATSTSGVVKRVTVVPVELPQAAIQTLQIKSPHPQSTTQGPPESPEVDVPLDQRDEESPISSPDFTPLTPRPATSNSYANPNVVLQRTLVVTNNQKQFSNPTTPNADWSIRPKIFNLKTDASREYFQNILTPDNVNRQRSARSSQQSPVKRDLLSLHLQQAGGSTEVLYRELTNSRDGSASSLRQVHVPLNSLRQMQARNSPRPVKYQLGLSIRLPDINDNLYDDLSSKDGESLKEVRRMLRSNANGKHKRNKTEPSTSMAHDTDETPPHLIQPHSSMSNSEDYASNLFPTFYNSPTPDIVKTSVFGQKVILWDNGQKANGLPVLESAPLPLLGSYSFSLGHRVRPRRKEKQKEKLWKLPSLPRIEEQKTVKATHNRGIYSDQFSKRFQRLSISKTPVRFKRRLVKGDDVIQNPDAFKEKELIMSAHNKTRRVDRFIRDKLVYPTVYPESFLNGGTMKRYTRNSYKEHLKRGGTFVGTNCLKSRFLSPIHCQFCDVLGNRHCSVCIERSNRTHAIRQERKFWRSL